MEAKTGETRMEKLEAAFQGSLELQRRDGLCMRWLVDKGERKNPSPVPSVVIMCGTGCVPHGGI